MAEPADAPAPSDKRIKEGDFSHDEDDSSGDEGAIATKGSAAAGAGEAGDGAPDASGTGADRSKMIQAIYRAPSTAGRGQVLTYGWMYKQGEGGFLRRRNWKRRFFVLYKVPQGGVLVYYENESCQSASILGFVDLRAASASREGSVEIKGTTRRMIEVDTPNRTFYLVPETITRSVSDAPDGTLLYILGWPVPEPELATSSMLDGSDGRGQNREVFSRWLEGIETLVEAEAASVQAEAEVRSDSTTMLPDHVILRVTPTDLVILDKEEPEKALACWAYRDLASWSTPVGVELHLTVKNPSGAIRCVFKTTKATKLRERMEQHVWQILELQKEQKKDPSA